MANSVEEPKPLPPLLPSHPVLSRSIQATLNLVLRDFLYTWYHDFTNDPQFALEIQHVLHDAVQTIHTRLERLNWPTLLLVDYPRLWRAHFRDYRQCMAKVGTVYGGGLLEFEDLFHQVQPHPALRLPLTEVRYFRRLTDRLLPLLLPARDYETPCVRYFVREILTDLVWKPIVEGFSDPSTWHELVINQCIAEVALEAWRKRYPGLPVGTYGHNPLDTVDVTVSGGIMGDRSKSALPGPSTVEELLQEAQNTSIKPPQQPAVVPTRPSSRARQTRPTSTRSVRSRHGLTKEPVRRFVPPKASQITFWQRATGWFTRIAGWLSLLAYAIYLGAFQLWAVLAHFVSVYTFSVSAHTLAGEGITPSERYPHLGKSGSQPRRRGYYARSLIELVDECLCLSQSQGWLLAHLRYYVLPLADQLAGAATDKFIEDQLADALSERKLAGLVDDLRRSLWPNGHFQRDRPVKTDTERIRLRHDAEILLDAVMPGVLRRLVPGGEQGDYAAARLLLDPLHSQSINRHLAFNTIDFLVGRVFPELVGEDSGPANASP
ncbi:hypothetical protein H4R33_002110 [Dimargaris cristalligena]|nr:hypothetical protein H4R33_002110 [Dimargaris cristalligena]